MARVKILVDFTGYPDGSDASIRRFGAGDEPDDLPQEFCDMIVEKGLAEAAAEETAPKRKGK